MDANQIVDLALSVRRGERRLLDLPAAEQAAVRQAMHRMTDAQFSRLAESRQSRSRVSERGFAVRGLHDGVPVR